MLDFCGAAAAVLAISVFSTIPNLICTVTPEARGRIVTFCITFGVIQLAFVVVWSSLYMNALSLFLYPSTATLFAFTLWRLVFSLCRRFLMLVLLLFTTVAGFCRSVTSGAGPLIVLFGVAGGWIHGAGRCIVFFCFTGGWTPF